METILQGVWESHHMMRRSVLGYLVLLVTLTCTATLASGQEGSRQEILDQRRQEKNTRLEPYEISSGEARVRGWENARWPQRIFIKGFHGIRPIIGGAPQGAGWLVGGLGYTYGLMSESWRFDAETRATSNRFYMVDLRVALPILRYRSPFRAGLDASFHDLKRVHFYGLGNEADDQESYYRTKNAWVGGFLTYAPTPLFEFRTDGKWLSNRVLPSNRGPTLEEVFDPASVPGYGVDRTAFAVYGGHLILNLRDRQIPWAGVVLRAEARRFDDQDLDQFDFTRLVGEVVMHIPLGYRNRVIAARCRTSHSMPDSGHQVPFNMMEAFGGSRTLRGFESNRFRDRRNLLFNVEYRWEVWTYLDFALFYDAGKVYSNKNGLSMTDMKRGTGGGIRIHTPTGTVLRCDLAKSYEGYQLYFWGGREVF